LSPAASPGGARRTPAQAPGRGIARPHPGSGIATQHRLAGTPQRGSGSVSLPWCSWAGQTGNEVDRLLHTCLRLEVRRPRFRDHDPQSGLRRSPRCDVGPGRRERQSGDQAPPGFADAFGWLVTAQEAQQPHWHVTFTVADRDESAEAAEQLGATVLSTTDSDWTRDALIRDPPGAVFTLSQYSPLSEY
jgi:hypothetical protein